MTGPPFGLRVDGRWRSELGISRSPGDRSSCNWLFTLTRRGFDLAGLRFTNGIEFLGHRMEYNEP
jgi:hypothetical protein